MINFSAFTGYDPCDGHDERVSLSPSNPLSHAGRAEPKLYAAGVSADPPRQAGVALNGAAPDPIALPPFHSGEVTR